MTTPPHITIYTDGGAAPNPGPGGWGALLIPGSGPIQEISGNEPDTTNNRMELTAAVEALRALKQPSTVTFYTDSQYLRKGISEWLPGWVRKGWTRGKGEAVKNQDLWQALHAETQRHTIAWKWVRGHAGNRYNERVDQLATAARERLTGPTPTRPTMGAADIEIALRVSVPKSGGAGGWAIRIAPADGSPVTHTGREVETTSNRLILAAALAALRHLPPGASARIYCPDDYLRGGMTGWVAGWQKKNWITSSGTPVKHRDLWEALADEARQRSIQWVIERGTPPDCARDLDRLAAEAARQSGS